MRAQLCHSYVTVNDGEVKKGVGRMTSLENRMLDLLGQVVKAANYTELQGVIRDVELFLSRVRQDQAAISECDRLVKSLETSIQAIKDTTRNSLKELK